MNIMLWGLPSLLANSYATTGMDGVNMKECS
ncbi:hypothetical protein GGR92_002888 [Spirosoma lacussanchae]